MTSSRILITLLFLAIPCLVLPLQAGPGTVILATTTSTQDSGLLDHLIPRFEKESGFRVKVIAVGSGQALKLGERGEADLLLVHSPDDEQRFMAAGHGVTRRPVMHNDFLIAGPPGDPAGVRGVSAVEAMRRIARRKAIFISRGDRSGTHAREMTLWKEAGVRPDGERWYQQTGIGMGQTLTVASEKQGYVLTDRGTYRSLERHLSLKILVEGDESLLNRYHVIELNPKKSSRINTVGARKLADFLLSPAAQEMIRTFGVQRYGAPLFVPDAATTPSTRRK